MVSECPIQAFGLDGVFSSGLCGARALLELQLRSAAQGLSDFILREHRSAHFSRCVMRQHINGGRVRPGQLSIT